jgi:hypothetical protein
VLFWERMRWRPECFARERHQGANQAVNCCPQYRRRECSRTGCIFSRSRTPRMQLSGGGPCCRQFRVTCLLERANAIGLFASSPWLRVQSMFARARIRAPQLRLYVRHAALRRSQAAPRTSKHAHAHRKNASRRSFPAPPFRSMVRTLRRSSNTRQCARSTRQATASLAQQARSLGALHVRLPMRLHLNTGDVFAGTGSHSAGRNRWLRCFSHAARASRATPSAIASPSATALDGQAPSGDSMRPAWNEMYESRLSWIFAVVNVLRMPA